MQYIYKAHSHAIKFQQSPGPFIYFPQTFAKICHMTHQRKTSLMRIPWRPSEDTQASLSDCLSWLCQIMVTINNEISVSGEAMGVIYHCNSSSFNVLSFRSIWYRLYSEDYSKLIRLTRPKVWLNNPRNLNHSPNFSIRLIIININHRTVTKAILKTDRCIWLGLHLDNVTYDTLEKPVQHRTAVYIQSSRPAPCLFYLVHQKTNTTWHYGWNRLSYTRTKQGLRTSLSLFRLKG